VTILQSGTPRPVRPSNCFDYTQPLEYVNTEAVDYAIPLAYTQSRIYAAAQGWRGGETKAEGSIGGSSWPSRGQKERARSDEENTPRSPERDRSKGGHG